MEQVVVTIVAPEALEEAITEDLQQIGVNAWHAWQVRGAGEHGLRPRRGRGPSVRIDAFVDRPHGDAILAMMAEKHPRSQSVFVAMTPAHIPG